MSLQDLARKVLPAPVLVHWAGGAAYHLDRLKMVDQLTFQIQFPGPGPKVGGYLAGTMGKKHHWLGEWKK